ncbi:MAG: deoxynucleoside kinase [Candidatus Babeliales bacterium]
MSNSTINISIEGNIGAGKSTILSIIQKWLPVNIVLEPHEKWQNVGGHNLLEKFYTDTPRWAYTFQTYAFVSRILAQQQNQQLSSINILERSVFSDRYCFAKNCYESGIMSALEWQLYKEWFSWLVDAYVSPMKGFIYLQADPAVCYKRLLKRNRSEEVNVSLEYLEKIHAKHEKWLIGKNEQYRDVPVLILECNKDFEHDIEEQEKHLQSISEFLNIPKKNNIKKKIQEIAL